MCPSHAFQSLLHVGDKTRAVTSKCLHLGYVGQLRVKLLIIICLRRKMFFTYNARKRHRDKESEILRQFRTNR